MKTRMEFRKYRATGADCGMSANGKGDAIGADMYAPDWATFDIDEAM